jgi:geranylgeranyl diphosphate synthase type I
VSERVIDLTAQHDFLERVRLVINDHLAAHLNDARRRAFVCGEATDAVCDALIELTLRGGKRMRPALMIASYIACGGEVELGGHDGEQLPARTRALFDVACAWELLQTYALIHDDWMDDDDLRRGGPTIHCRMADRYGDRHVGACVAILAGDLACALSHRILAHLDAPSDLVRDCTSIVTKIEEEVILGQILDVTSSPSEEVSIEQIYELKTTSYTVRGPVEIGARFADAPPAVVSCLRAYSAAVGLAFQLRDDLLALWGHTDMTGKRSLGDLHRRKTTAIVLETRKLASAGDRVRFDALLVSDALSPTQEDEFLQLIIRSGAQAAIASRIDALLTAAETMARSEPFPRENGALLTSFINMLRLPPYLAAGSLEASRARESAHEHLHGETE